MKYADRNGKRWDTDTSQDVQIRKLYASLLGRLLMKLLTFSIFSKLGGSLLKSGFSKRFIRKFIEKNNIDISQCTSTDWKSYNEFFTRQLKQSARPIVLDPNILISPCDSKLFVSEINEKSLFHIKHTAYDMSSILQDNVLSDEFMGGTALIFRLTVDDYHRYCYFDDGEQVFSKFIKGRLHTVNPIANDIYPIYKENCREYAILKTSNFGKSIFMEVGALMVGKISNHKKTGYVKRGEEKGMFEFGGSTVVLFFKKDAVKIDDDIISNSNDGYETIVKLGEKIGFKN